MRYNYIKDNWNDFYFLIIFLAAKKNLKFYYCYNQFNQSFLLQKKQHNRIFLTKIFFTSSETCKASNCSLYHRWKKEDRHRSVCNNQWITTASNYQCNWYLYSLIIKFKIIYPWKFLLSHSYAPAPTSLKRKPGIFLWMSTD